jgi:hypothetical protein
MPNPPLRSRVETSEGGTATNRVNMMKRVFLDRPKARHAPPPDPLPIDPRDPDVVRAKARIYREPARAKVPRRQS